MCGLYLSYGKHIWHKASSFLQHSSAHHSRYRLLKDLRWYLKLVSLPYNLYPRMELLDFWNGGANVLIWGRKFWVSKIIQGLKHWGPKSAICRLEFGVREIIWTMKFLVCHCFFETGQLVIWGFWKSWADSLGVWVNCLTLAPPFQKSRNLPTDFLKYETVCKKVKSVCTSTFSYKIWLFQTFQCLVLLSVLSYIGTPTVLF